MSVCAGVRRLAAGAALGDLTPAEERRLERHRAVCASCRSHEAALAAVVVELSLVAPVRRPPASVLTGIRSAIRG